MGHESTPDQRPSGASGHGCARDVLSNDSKDSKKQELNPDFYQVRVELGFTTKPGVEAMNVLNPDLLSPG